MNIINPPKISTQALVELALKKLKQGVQLRITDEKSRYVHWEKLRYLSVPAEFENSEQYWHFIRFSRIQQQKNLPFLENFTFVLTDDIQEKIHQIDAKMLGSIQSENLFNHKKRYIIGSLMDEAINSSQLEGASTTRKVAKKMLQNHQVPKDYSQQMIANNYQAIQFIDQYKHDDLTPELILELHRIVTDGAIDTPEDAGRLRQNNSVSVVDNNTQKSLHNPPDCQSLSERMKILCDFANGNSPDYFMHPIIRAIIVHFVLAFDHPFVDGNGRTTRALFYWVILKNNYWLFQYITLSKYIKVAQIQYGESFLMTENDNFDLTYFINSQLKFILQAIQGVFDYVDKQQNQMQQALNLLSAYLADGAINARQAVLIQHAIQHLGAVYTIEGHKISQHISYKTAREDLLGLAKLNLLQQSKRGRAFVFIAPADLEARIKLRH